MLLQVGHVAALTLDTSFLGLCIPHDLILDPAGLETAGQSWGCLLLSAQTTEGVIQEEGQE